jgi:hypothetical protein
MSGFGAGLAGCFWRIADLDTVSAQNLELGSKR